jgi:hypothetical protein
VAGARQNAAAQGKPLKVMFMDEARFGRITEPRRCWAPKGCRPLVLKQAIRQYTYAYGAVCPAEGGFDSLILPDMRAECLNVFLAELSRRHPDAPILLFMDGAGSHKARNITVPANITFHQLPPYSPECNPTENLWDEMREKDFANHTFHSMEAVETTLVQSLRRLETNPDLVRSITSFPWIICS